MKICIEPDCWNVTAGTRCVPHEKAYQRARNLRRGKARTPQAAYRKLSLEGKVCACCGTSEDLTRHHVQPLSSPFLQNPDRLAGPMVAMCRPCNSSIGTRVMEGRLCPMHGGVVRGG